MPCERCGPSEHLRPSRVPPSSSSLGLVLLSLNLRPAAVSVGPVLAEVRDALGMSPAAAGLLTSLPVLGVRGLRGARAGGGAHGSGVHRVTLLALLAAVARARSAARSPTARRSSWCCRCSRSAGWRWPTCCCRRLVKLHFPDRIGRVTAIYTTALAVGLTGALLVTVPLSQAAGGWRWGLGAWAAVALLAALPWVGLVAHDRSLEPTQRSIRAADVARTRLGLAMALFFGLQSLQAYSIFGWFAQLWRDNGYTAGQAGALVALVAAMSIPLSLWAPAAVARRTDQRAILLAIMACYPLGYVGLIVAPHGFAVPGAILVGVGAVTFPIVLTLIGLRARTPQGTAALSGFTQSTGYLIAALGPFAMARCTTPPGPGPLRCSC